MAVHLRYCPACREEYQPHMVRCIECGTALKDLLEDEAPAYDPPKQEEPLLPEGDYRPIVGSLDSAQASRLMTLFKKAGIPIKVEAVGGMHLSARKEDLTAATEILVREGLVDEPTDAPAVAAEGGPCPACGTDIARGTLECPDCGLLLGAAELACEKCGTAYNATEDACPDCGHRED